MSAPIHSPYVILRCRKCSGKTDHVLVSTTDLSDFGKSEREEIYECQQCGETKKIYAFADSFAHSPLQYSIEQGLKEPRNEVKMEKKKDHLEVTIKKKKRRFF